MTKDDIRQRIRNAVPHMPLADRVRRISLFGSYLHGNATPESDVDLLVELSEPVGFFDFVGMQFHLERSLGKRIDLLTLESLSKYFRQDVLEEAEQLYER